MYHPSLTYEMRLIGKFVRECAVVLSKAVVKPGLSLWLGTSARGF